MGRLVQVITYKSAFLDQRFIATTATYLARMEGRGRGPERGMMLKVLRKVFAIVAGCIGFVFGVASGLQLNNYVVLPFLTYTLFPNTAAYGDVPVFPTLVPFVLGLLGAWIGVKVHSKLFPAF